MRRRQLKKPARKRLRQPVPDRADPTKLIVGPMKAFSGEQLSGLRVASYDNDWLVLFSGPGYEDFDKCCLKTTAEACVKVFVNAYPDVEVSWLKYRETSNVKADRQERQRAVPQRRKLGVANVRDRLPSPREAGNKMPRRRSRDYVTRG